jgi:hypothetical protein
MGKNHMDLTDGEFLSQFESCTLDPDLFSHQAHLRLAWCLIRRDGIEDSIYKICDQIESFDKEFGGGMKFNKTLTVACIYAVYHFMIKSDKETFSEFIKENPRLITNLKDLILQHYSEDVFRNAEAKKGLLQPNIQPFDDWFPLLVK